MHREDIIFFGSVIAIIVGCVIGMFLLVHILKSTTDKLHKENKVVELYNGRMQEFMYEDTKYLVFSNGSGIFVIKHESN